MAVVHYYYRSTKEEGNLTMRFTHGRGIDLLLSTEINIPKKSWNKKLEKVKNTSGLTNAGKINKQLEDLGRFVIDNFNHDRLTGGEFNKEWIQNQYDLFSDAPKHAKMDKEKAMISQYFTVFARDWADRNLKTGRYKNADTGLPLKYKSVNHYYLCVGFLEKYELERMKESDPEKRLKGRLKHSDINVAFCNDFILWMSSEIEYTQPYSLNYVAKTIQRIKFFGFRSAESNHNMNKEFSGKSFKCPTDDTMHPYLNPHEIQKINDYDFSKLENLDIARDWLVIGCYTALRVSDLLYVDKDRVSNLGIIELFKTTKTGEPVAIPMHPLVKAILDKRKGEFPPFMRDQTYNKLIKDVCKDVGLKQKMKGVLKDPETNRLKVDYYEKWELISSHIGRRSFATNHFGQVPNKTLMDIGGWRTESAFLIYIKKKDITSAKELQAFWDNGGGQPLKKVN